MKPKQRRLEQRVIETHQTFRVKNMNARSMRNKMKEIETVLRDERVDIACIQETWLLDSVEGKEPDPTPHIHGYKWYGKARNSKTRGGVWDSSSQTVSSSNPCQFNPPTQLLRQQQ